MPPKTFHLQLPIQEKLKRFLRAEMKRADLTYRELHKRMVPLGWNGNEDAVRNRISRGRFPADFLILCLIALGTTQFNIEFFKE